MALKFRRGTDSGRAAITPAEGEPIYTTDTKQLYIGDGTTAGGVAVGGGGGVSDGDKGDITVSGTGATWTIDNDAVTYAKIQNVSAASKLLGRGDSGSGDVQEITLGTGLTMTGTTLAASGGGGGGDIPTFMVVKSADETVLNSDQAQNDDELVFSAPAFNRPYYFEATIYVERSNLGGGGDQPGIKYAIGNSSAVQGLYNVVPIYPNSPISVYGAFAGISTGTYSASITQPIVLKLQGSFRPLSSSAVLQFMWAQNTPSTSVGTVVKKGSKLLVWDLS
jgi:hypothetical protein